MALFQQSAAEKKLAQLTGGPSLSDEYRALLKANNIDIATGRHIRKQLKEEIKLDIVSAEGLETRIRYLIKKHAKVDVQEEPDEDVTQISNDSAGLKAYGVKISQLKGEFDFKEKKVKELIEKRFSPPQITYDKFMNSVKNCHDVFYNQYESASNIIKLVSEDSPKVNVELENKITELNSIIDVIDDLINELLLNINSSTNKDLENLHEDMQDLIDSVKNYD